MGAGLSVIPSRKVRWSVWLREHPNTQVLSDKTGYFINYQVNPYAQYENSDEVAFPARRESLTARSLRKRAFWEWKLTGNTERTP
jgi:hypothetical protein